MRRKGYRNSKLLREEDTEEEEVKVIEEAVVDIMIEAEEGRGGYAR